MEQFVVDTHSLLWYVSSDNRIGHKAKTKIDKAEAGEIKIIVPAIVLIEVIDIIKKARIIHNFDKLLEWIHQISYHEIKNLDSDIINLYKDYSSSIKLESHDKVIIVTAQYFNNSPIVTKDSDIQRVYQSTIW